MLVGEEVAYEVDSRFLKLYQGDIRPYLVNLVP